MLILFHVAVALFSIIYTTYLFVFPSKSKFRISYTLAVLTVTSGSYLVLSTRAHILQACVTGLVYIGAVCLAIVAAKNKLAAEVK